MTILDNLPLDIIRKIWEYDGTYREYNDEEVLPYIERSWAIKWIDGETGDFGLDCWWTNVSNSSSVSKSSTNKYPSSL